MKAATLCTTILSIVLIGCSNEESSEVSQLDSPATDDDSHTTYKPVSDDPVTGDDVEREIGEAINTTVEFTKQKRDEYAEGLEQKLAELDNDIARMEEKAGALKDDAKQKWAEQIAKLREQRKAAAEKLAKVKESSAEAWQELKTSMDSSWTSLKEGVSDAASELSKEADDHDPSTEEKPQAN